MSSKNATRRVALCLATDPHENILMGLRKDCGKWTVPGGHLEKGEDPYQGALRELHEEVGAHANDIKLVKVEWNKKKNLLLYLFRVDVDHTQEFTAENDPDGEFSHISYVDPNSVMEELHVPAEDNVALKYWAYN